MSLESQLAKAEDDLATAKTKMKTGLLMCGGGFLAMFASAASIDSGVDFGTGFLFMIIFGGIVFAGIAYSGDNGAAAQEEIDRLKAAMQSTKRNLKQKERELKEAKRLMEKGGIGNLNKAIGIFKKYGK